MSLLEDDNEETRESEEQTDENPRMKDLQTPQRDKRTINPLSLLKVDLSQFKDGVTSVFSISSSKDKETKAEHEDSGQTDSKCVSGTQGLLREDLSHLKEEVTSVFSISLSKDKETKSTEKTINLLSLLKEDFNHFKDDISNVFRTGLSKERGTAKEDSSNPFKIKSSTAERTEEPFKSLFRQDQRTSQKAGNSETVKKTFSETSQEQTVGSLRENQREESVEREDSDLKDGVDGPEDSELDVTSYEEKTDKVQAAKQRCEREARTEDKAINEEEEEEEEEPSEKLLWESLSSGISLFNLRDPNKDDRRDRPGDDLWSVKNFACYLTFDPNTANSELHLSDGNRMATRVWSDHRPLDHPDRFERCPQVLCREGLLDSVYWEVMWSGGADIGVTYNSISRDGAVESCLLGHNEQSWSLECSEGSYTPCHHNKRFRSSSPRPFTHRVGVHLDWAAGSLSFYCISQDTMVHLHTFTSTFTEPLYPGFWVWAYDGSVSLCQVELDWERLLQ